MFHHPFQDVFFRNPDGLFFRAHLDIHLSFFQPPLPDRDAQRDADEVTVLELDAGPLLPVVEDRVDPVAEERPVERSPLFPCFQHGRC